MGNRAADILSQTSCFSLKSLVISSDPIGNRGIKKLMKVNFPNLLNLRIENSNITTDFVKMLRHK